MQAGSNENSIDPGQDDLAFDARHIWHPYSSITRRLPVFPVASASGVRLTLTDGRELVDGMSSWWSAIHGYNHPELNAAITRQMQRMAHVMFGGLTHQPAIELAKKLVAMTPAGLSAVFFADSGSVSVEVAIKMAIQYWRSLGNTRKQRLLTVRHGYHGDTLGAMAVCDPVNGMHSLFRDILPEHLFVEAPQCRYDDVWEERFLKAFADAIRSNHEDLVAVILEPVVQGAGGMRFYAPDYLRRASEVCQESGVLLILDEIATGFGRTGTLFGCEQAGVTPDIMCLGKALTGGYMTLAATLCTDEVSHTISDNGVFMHGPTFMANPLACSVAGASMDILDRGEWQAQVKGIEEALKEELTPLAGLSRVADVRVLGAIGVVEMKEPVDMPRVQPMFVAEGVWVRPFGRLVYVMPPYIICREDLALLGQGIRNVVRQL